MTDFPTLVSLLPFRAEPSLTGRYRKYLSPRGEGGGGLTGTNATFLATCSGKRTSISNAKKMSYSADSFFKLLKRLTARVFSSQNCAN